MKRFFLLLLIVFGILIGEEFNSTKFHENYKLLLNASQNHQKIKTNLSFDLPQEPFPLFETTNSSDRLNPCQINTTNSRLVEWDRKNATHLLNRTMFGPTFEEISTAENLGLEATINQILNPGDMPSPPAEWYNEPVPANIDQFTQEQIDSLITEYYIRFNDMRSWWIDLILESELSIREMMALFWHDHFATSQDKIIIPSTMYKQNDLIRTHALGNIKDLVKEMAYDPAMLLWLDNNQNKVRRTHVTGSFENWTGNGPQLTDDNGDGIYSTTISLPPGYYQYKFNCGGWEIHDDAPPQCSENAQYQNRGLAVNYNDLNLDSHAWNECSENISNGPSTVTINVDMTGVDLQGGNVYITGNMDNWSGMGLQLEHIGNNIYSASIELNPGQYEYLITVSGEFDDWSGWGMVDNPEQGSFCDFNPNDEWANYGFALANGQPHTVNKIWNECFVEDEDNLYEVTFNLTEPPCPNGINENFARELLELFTIGIGNYSQEDIIEAARAYSGYTTDGLNVYFNPLWHDYGDKTFFGQTGNWDGDDIVDIIFEQEETSKFFARKIYKWFVYDIPNEEVVNELAQVLINNDFEISPMLEALFSSEHFYDANFKGSSIKSTLWHTIGSVRKLYIDEFSPIEDLTKHGILIYVQNLLGQVMFLPPDVSGWPGYRTWINTYTLPWRKTFTGALVDGSIYNFDIGMQLNALEFVQHFSDPDDAELLVEELYTYLLAMEPTEQVKELLLQELLQGLQPYNWNTNIPGADLRIRNLVKLTMKLADFQLQ